MLDDNQIIRGCRKHKRTAQEALYEKYAPVLRGICLRYSRNKTEAEDLLQDGFIKIFLNINKFSGKGSFGGWLKRIMVNTAITQFKKNKYHYNIDEINELEFADNKEDDNEQKDIKSIILNGDLSKEDLLNVVNKLPEGFKMVFNLYVIENYSHKEIAKTLKISVNTSKSQLSRARKLIQKKLYEICISKKNCVHS